MSSPRDPSPTPTPGRRQRYAARTARAAATKRRIVEAAYQLFADRGYLDTTMADIAQAAGVAVQTLYLSFGSKVKILNAALDTAVGGDDQPVALIARPWLSTLAELPDGPRAIALLVHEGRKVIERASRIHFAMRAAAADIEVADLLAKQAAERYQAMQAMAGIVAQKPGFAGSLGTAHLADVLYGTLGPDTYRLFCLDRHWTHEQWEAWLTAMLTATYFPDDPVESTHPS